MNRTNASAAVKAAGSPRWDEGLPAVLVLDFSAIPMTDDQLVQFCADNGDLRIVLTAKRELIIMAPANMTTGWQNGEISGQLYIWRSKFRLHPCGAKGLPPCRPTSVRFTITDEQPDFLCGVRVPMTDEPGDAILPNMWTMGCDPGSWQDSHSTHVYKRISRHGGWRPGPAGNNQEDSDGPLRQIDRRGGATGPG